MKDLEVQNLVYTFEQKHKVYDGWTFDYEHPGYFVYYQDDGNLAVYFTPDYDDQKGNVSIQINKGDDPVYHEKISYVAPLKAPALFGIVRPYLDLLGAVSK